MIDSVCVFHGRKQSEHVCLYCCICFRDLTPDECSTDGDGVQWDVCNPCAELERSANEALYRTYLRSLLATAAAWRRKLSG